MRLERLPAAAGKQKEATNTSEQNDRFDQAAESPQGRFTGARGSVGGAWGWGGEGSGLHIKE